MGDAGDSPRGSLDIFELEAHLQGEAPRRKRPKPQSRPLSEVVRGARVGGVLHERLVVGAGDRARCAGAPVHGQHRGPEPELVRRVPARGPPERVDAGDPPVRELDSETVLVERQVREVPRSARTAAAGPVEGAERGADSPRRLPEPDPAERSAGHEHARLRQAGRRGRGEEESGHRGGDQAPPHMLGSMSLWDSVAELPVKVDGYTLERRESSTPLRLDARDDDGRPRGRRRDRPGRGRHVRGRAARRRAGRAHAGGDVELRRTSRTGSTSSRS